MKGVNCLKEHHHTWSLYAFLIMFLVPTAVGSAPMNVLFFVVDDLRPTLGCYGDPIMHTKNIDNLASKSVVFDQAYVQQAICGPSRISFLTSRRPDTTRLYDFYSYWRVHAGNYTTLPQHFKEHGYITQSVGKVFHPGIASNYTDDARYSWTNTPYHPSTQKYKMAKVCPNKDGSLGMNIVCPVDVDKMPEKTLPDLQSAEFAVNFLQNMSKLGQKKPFFLAVGFHKPHIPLKYPKEYLDLYPLSEIHLAPHHTIPLRLPLVAWNPWTDLRERDDVKALNVSFPFGPVPEHFQLLMRQSYYAATTYMDAQVGKVLAALEENGFSKNTIISFLGDHGWSLGEHQEWSKFSLYGVASRVPLMVSIPGLTHSKQQDLSSDSSIPPGDQTLFPFHDALSSDSMNWAKASGGVATTKGRANEAEGSKDGTSSLLRDEVLYKTGALVELVDLFPTLAEAAGLPNLPLCPKNPFNTWLCTEGSSLMQLIKHVIDEGGADSMKTEFSTQSSTLSSASDLSFISEREVVKQQLKRSVDTVMNESHIREDAALYKAALSCDPTFVPYHHHAYKTHSWKRAVFSQYPRPSVEPREDSDKPHLKHIRIMGYSMWTTDVRYTEWADFTPTNYTVHWAQNHGRELYLRTTDPAEAYNLAYFERCSTLVDEMSKRLHQGWREALPS